MYTIAYSINAVSVSGFVLACKTRCLIRLSLGLDFASHTNSVVLKKFVDISVDRPI